MKKIILITTVLCGFLLASCGGNGGRPAKHGSASQMDGKAMVEMMNQVMDLSEDQETSLIRLYDEFSSEMKEMDKAAKMEKMSEMNEKIMEVLDEEQQQIFKGFMKMHRSMGSRE